MIIDLKDATIKLKDAGSNELELRIGSGNLSYTENRPIDYTKDKGRLWKTRLGDEEPMDVTMDIVWEYLRSLEGTTEIDFYTLSGFTGIGASVNGVYEYHSTISYYSFANETLYGTANAYYCAAANRYLYFYQSGTSSSGRWVIDTDLNSTATIFWSSPSCSVGDYPDNSNIWVLPGGGEPDDPTGISVRTQTPATAVAPTPYEVFKHIGNAADWVSTADDACEPFCVDLEIFFDRSCGRTEKITIPKLRYETLTGDLGEGTLAFAGKANVREPTVTES